MLYIVKAPSGRYFRVRSKNLNLIPATWKLMTNRSASKFYHPKTGKIVKTMEGIKEIKSKKDIDIVGANYKTEFDLLFGRLSQIQI